ncbi:MAG: GAF domain-containing protein [Thermodesulfobacteriota bacterium]|nr:GAF domain-containing protein [Thermodesulfobacteriota bacterium]
MSFYKWLGEDSLKNRNLYYKLNIIFGLFFLFPVFGFIYFAYKYDILTDKFVPVFFMVVLVFSFFGFVILKNLFDKIKNISEKMTGSFITEVADEKLKTGADELQNIIQSFTAINKQFAATFKQLEKKGSEISILKELSELCYVTFDPEEILYVALERSLMLTNSDIGSVLTLEKGETKEFVVKASVGLGEYVKLGDRIKFETSIAKYAVINKSPLIVKDVEKDRRFGRVNLQHYGTKSFVCMPIKTSKDIIGVLTLSRKDDNKVYSQDVIEVLTPLLSNAAFTYENIRLLKDNKQGSLQLRSIEKIFKVINSSFRDSELVQAILNEIHTVVPFDIAVVMTKDENMPGYLTVSDLMASGPTGISKGDYYSPKGSVIEKVLKQESTIIVDDNNLSKEDAEIDRVGYVANKLEKELFAEGTGGSCLLTPLKTDSVLTGILALYAKRAELFYHAQNVIEWVANGLAIAIERSRLTASVLKRNQELDSIKQIGRALASSTFDISKVLKYTMDMIRVIMNVEAGSLLFLENDELELAVAFNVKVKIRKKFRLKIGQGIAGHVAASGESIIVNDTKESPHFFSGVDKHTGFKTKSVLCVPMISQGKVLGVIQVLNKKKGGFSLSDEDLLQSIATSVSIAIENARLYKEKVSMAEHERSIRRMFQKFVPKEVLETIIDSEETGKGLVEEFKKLTLLNLDIRGFTELAMEMGPQKTVFLLNSFFSVMGSIVFKYNGIVDKYLGDGFLAIFGAPVSSIKDAQNALTAALEMKESIKEVNENFEKELGTSVNIGISIHTGEVVVGNIGFEKKMDYTVIGDAVNTVFRMQEFTKSYPNGIIIGENTRRAVDTRLKIRKINKALGGLKLYELLDIKDISEDSDKILKA